MKKRMISVIAVITLALMLCACGSKTFRCAVCMKQVNQVPKQMTVLGQDVEVCKSCYSQLKK